MSEVKWSVLRQMRHASHLMHSQLMGYRGRSEACEVRLWQPDPLGDESSKVERIAPEVRCAIHLIPCTHSWWDTEAGEVRLCQPDIVGEKLFPAERRLLRKERDAAAA